MISKEYIGKFDANKTMEDPADFNFYERFKQTETEVSN